MYRNDIKAERNFGKYALFVSFFPQLVAGPIEKSKDLLNQFKLPTTFDYERFKDGLFLMLWGFFQKIVVADKLAILVNKVYENPSNYYGFEIIIATIFFAFQIYCDFSSYSDIAIGAAKVLGFNLTQNFKQPYFAESIKDFWRRWHISLTSWFRDYLYIPLGGNRKGTFRKYINILIVFMCSGLWHGAAITFVIWGTLHGLYQIIGDILKPLKEKLINLFKIKTDVFSFKLLKILTTFILVDFAWIFFRANSFTDAKILIKNMFTFNPWVLFNNSLYNLGLDSKDFTVAILGITVVLIINFIQSKFNFTTFLNNQNLLFRWCIYFIIIIAVVILGAYGPGFDAQQFIYFQF